MSSPQPIDPATKARIKAKHCPKGATAAGVIMVRILPFALLACTLAALEMLVRSQSTVSFTHAQESFVLRYRSFEGDGGTFRSQLEPRAPNRGKQAYSSWTEHSSKESHRGAGGGCIKAAFREDDALFCHQVNSSSVDTRLAQQHRHYAHLGSEQHDLSLDVACLLAEHESSSSPKSNQTPPRTVHVPIRDTQSARDLATIANLTIASRDSEIGCGLSNCRLVPQRTQMADPTYDKFCKNGSIVIQDGNKHLAAISVSGIQSRRQAGRLQWCAAQLVGVGAFMTGM